MGVNLNLQNGRELTKFSISFHFGELDMPSVIDVVRHSSGIGVESKERSYILDLGTATLDLNVI